jgi:hypothetical protein
MIERMVEAAWTGILRKNILEHHVGQRWGHRPGTEEVSPFSVRHTVHRESPNSAIDCPSKADPA